MRAAEQQPVLEPEARAHAVEPRVLLAHEVRAVGVRAEAERDDLRADDHQQRAGDHRVQVPRAAEDVDLRERRCSDDQRAEQRPSPRPGSMNRCVGLWTSRKRRWRQPSRKLESFDSPPRGWYSIGNSADVELLLGGADDHLGGELHAGRAQVERAAGRRGGSARMPQWASRDAGAEEEVEDAGEHRVADVAVQPRHRARLDVVHPVAHHQLGAVVELARRSAGSRRSRRSGRRRPSRCTRRGRRRSRPGRRCRSRGAARARRARRRAAASSALPSSEPLSATTTSPAMPGRRRAPSRARVDALLDVLRLVEAGDHDRDERRSSVGGVPARASGCARSVLMARRGAAR